MQPEHRSILHKSLIFGVFKAINKGKNSDRI